MAQQPTIPPQPPRRAMPSKVQTSFLPTIPSTSVPTSAISASSLTSSSQQASPVLSPQTQLTTNNSSVQGSPGPDLPKFSCDSDIPLPFELPESIVQRKNSQSAMSEAMALSKGPGIIRRLSNKASKFAGRRRQSSAAAAANSRDHSSGPVIMRRRSDSTSTAPEARPALLTESDDESREDSRDEMIGIADGMKDYYSSGSPNGSISGLPINDGPVIPALLLQGTTMLKVSKKKRKLLTFALDIDAAKVSWDKNRPSKAFYIDDIKEIRSGADARNYRLEFGVPAYDERRFFSILYVVSDKSKGRSQKLMHLIAGDDRTFELWTTTLDAISKHRHELMASLSSFNDKAVRAYWRREMNKQFGDRAHSEDEEMIDITGVERLCRSLHIHGVNNHLRAKFAQVDELRCGLLTYGQFQEFINLMKRREDVRALYNELTAPDKKGITLEDFMEFLQDTQGEDVEGRRTHWTTVFAKFVRRSKTKEQAQQDQLNGETPVMNESALASYVTSTYNVPIKDVPANFTLDRPLHEYYISSSHNTYLLGRQVAGQSSVEAYISALSKGCRCVEVDCWDGNEGPVVMHGRTLTSQVSFADVMTTISKYAFVSSQFPLLISLEVHCSRQQQIMMAEIIKASCGSKLVTEPLDPNTQQLPSPSQLMNRILIKVKMPCDEPSFNTEVTAGRRRGASVNSPYVRPTVLDNSMIPNASILQSPPMSPRQRPTMGITRSQTINVRVPHQAGESQDSLSNSTSESESMNDDGSEKRKQQSNIVKVLGDLGVYTAGVKFHGFDTPESKTYNHIYSFMEATFAKNSKTPDTKRALVRHNMRHMMRVYPNGWRVASTNFDPLTYWRRGVQMAALNWQTYDLGMQINDAMFEGGTDVSGYVLKPSGLREITMLPNVPEAAGEGYVKRERKLVTFSIEVISAQQLMRPKNLPATRTVDPYVEVEVFHADDKAKDVAGVVGEGGPDAAGRGGSSGLGAPRRLRTQIVPENGFNPLFNQKFKFALTTKYPDLVFVRWTVRASRDGHSYDDRGTPLAAYTAKLGSLKQGYRTLPLMDANGDQFLFSTLFCKVKVKEATSVYVDGPPEAVGKLKSLGRSIIGRTQSTPVMPRTPDSA